MNRKNSLRFRLASLLLLGPLLFASGCGGPRKAVAPPGALPDLPSPEPPIHRLLFIHGWQGLARDFSHYYAAAVDRLPARCEVYIVTGLDRRMGCLSAGNDGVVDQIELFLDSQDIPMENLHLVAHSMGGLAARRFVTRHPGAVRQVFLLGTPSGGVRAFRGVNFSGWCTPEGIAAFNEANPPDPAVQWFVVAGNHYKDRLSGAFWEGVPNDGLVATASVLRFVELCGDSIPVTWRVGNLTHPDWNWGANLLRSRRVVDWVVDRIIEDVSRH